MSNRFGSLLPPALSLSSFKLNTIYRMFQNLISRLSVTVTPQHPSLQIPDKYLISYPWSEAQSQANALTIYRSPKDKLQAAVRCCQTVLHLLQLADEYAPASDDMIPVLLFVLIKVRKPKSLRK